LAYKLWINGKGALKPMIQYKKKELLDSIHLLNEANRSVRNAGKNKLPLMADTLVKCQETAIQIGNFLETKGETGGKVVHQLESYCENIYQQSMCLDDEIRCRKLAKKIQTQLSQITNEIRYGLPDDRKEIVFLPYKASMWDCLESVWMAACEDRSCDVYVVPIPYFEKNPDGSFGQMHYEGDEYPEYVPITNWREYKIEEHRPDMVYIHNPYDNQNLVTSVHPAFYSIELKKYTDMLVYIPYFIGIGNKVEEHFCILPGVLYSDKIILESEEVKQIYLEQFRKFEQEYNCKGRFCDLDKKILCLGSPKLDRVKKVVSSGEIEIPSDWKRKIYRPDGARKKVVFYNTTVAALLKYSDTYLEKLRSVLNIFRKEENCVLLWRPHPLLESTIKTMRNYMSSEYGQIVRQYIEEDWGIYDGTADVERAIVLSDAYYGDMSSVVELYRKTRKPIMIQNCGMIHGRLSE